MRSYSVFVLVTVLSLSLAACDSGVVEAPSSSELAAGDNATLSGKPSCPCWSTTDDVVAEFEARATCLEPNEADLIVNHHIGGDITAIFGCVDNGLATVGTVDWTSDSKQCWAIETGGSPTPIESIQDAEACLTLIWAGVKVWNRSLN